MANTLTGLIPTLYEALDKVSRELVGFVPSVARNTDASGAAKDQVIRIPITPTATTDNIVPGTAPGNDGDQTIGYADMKITKSKYSPVRWNGEEQLGVGSGGKLQEILRDQFANSMRALVNEVEADLAALYFNASRPTGTAGTTPFASTLADPAEARRILADNGAPMSDLQLVIDTAAGAKLRTLAQLTKANEAGSDSLLRQGVLLDIHGFAIRESAQVKTATQAAAANYVTDDVQAVGSTSIAVKTGSAAIGKGAIVSFAADTKNKYVVTEDFAGGAGDLKINAPGLRVELPDANAMTVNTTAFAANMAFDRNAIQLITRVPAMPEGGDAAEDVVVVTDPVSGLSFQVAIYRQYKQVKYEVGLAWGVQAIKPAHMALLLG